MNLYLDTEFNGHGGELISLAIAAPDGKHWYGLVPKLFYADPATHPWVRENVLPVTSRLPRTDAFISMGGFRASLHEYLETRSGSIIYADWPADFRYLMQLMEGPSYDDSWVVDIGMQLLDASDPKPEIPHNALSDAIALMHWHLAR